MKPETKQEYAARMKLEQNCRDVGRTIASVMPPGKGFAFLMFDLGDGGGMAYISNAERADMISALEELVDRLRRGQD